MNPIWNPYLNVLRTVPLFSGLDDTELSAVLNCLGAQYRRYHKNSFIFQAGDAVSNIGVVLAGQIQVSREDVSGNRTILAVLSEGDLFAEAFVCAQTKTLPVSVSAVTDSVILFADYSRITSGCSQACGFHSRIIRNMMAILAHKNIMLSQKIEHISQRTTREKLLSYLNEQATRAGSPTFTIPFSRQELADYLCVERSAMSAALSAMRRDGVLDYHKSRFTLVR